MGSLAEAAAVRAVIADDEPLARQQLRDLLADVPWLAIVGEAGDRRHQPLRRLYVRVGGRIIPVAVEKILHCEARGDYVALHTADGCYVVNTSVEYLADRLSPESFVRIHRSRIVNLEAVVAF